MAYSRLRSSGKVITNGNYEYLKALLQMNDCEPYLWKVGCNPKNQLPSISKLLITYQTNRKHQKNIITFAINRQVKE